MILSVEKDEWRSAGRKFLRRGDSGIELDLLPPGVYSATAWTEPFGRLIGWMEPVVLAAGLTTGRTLLAGGASEVKIMVLDAASGAAVNEALVQFQVRGAPVQLEAASREDGIARLPSVPPAVWDLAVKAAGRRGLAEPLEVHGEGLERTVKLEAAPCCRRLAPSAPEASLEDCLDRNNPGYDFNPLPSIRSRSSEVWWMRASG